MDKDHAAVVLAESVGADALLLLTDVPAVCLGHAGVDATRVRRLTLRGAADGVRDGTFAAGSMGPKVAAAAEFVRRTGGIRRDRSARRRRGRARRSGRDEARRRGAGLRLIDPLGGRAMQRRGAR